MTRRYAALILLPISCAAAGDLDASPFATSSDERVEQTWSADVTLGRGLEAWSIEVSPTSIDLTPAQQTMGYVVAVSATVRDFDGQPLPNAGVRLSCPPKQDAGDVQWTPIAPDRRFTDAAGRVVLEASITSIGRIGARPTNVCNLTIGAVEGHWVLSGQRIVVFEASFD